MQLVAKACHLWQKYLEFFTKSLSKVEFLPSFLALSSQEVLMFKATNIWEIIAKLSFVFPVKGWVGLKCLIQSKHVDDFSDTDSC